MGERSKKIRNWPRDWAREARKVGIRPGVGRKKQEKCEPAQKLGERSKKIRNWPRDWAREARKLGIHPGAGREKQEKRGFAQEVDESRF